MSFSARQQHCLEAMGIVPWVSKVEPAVLSTAPESTEPSAIPNLKIGISTETATSTSSAAEQVFDSTAFVPTPMPERIEQLKMWLPTQPLGALTVRSEQQVFIGQPEAPLLVVVDSNLGSSSLQPAAGAAFTAEAAQLFDLMMRAINVTLGQRKLCRLVSKPDASDVAEFATVSQLCVAQTRAILLLVHDWNSLSVPITDHFRLDQPPLPVWRIPHPDLLLEFNQLKRQAWTSLQALQSALL